MKLPSVGLVSLTGLLHAHFALADIQYYAWARQNPNDPNKWCLDLRIADDYWGGRTTVVSYENCDSFTYPGENQLAWDFAGRKDWYYAKVKAHHLWLIRGLGVTYGTDHGTFYFDIDLHPAGNDEFEGYGFAL